MVQEAGTLAELKNRWWVERIQAQGIICPTEKKGSAAAAELDIGNVGGVFVVLLAGTGIGCLIVVLEFIWKTKKVARHERVSLIFILTAKCVILFIRVAFAFSFIRPPRAMNVNTRRFARKLTHHCLALHLLCSHRISRRASLG